MPSPPLAASQQPVPAPTRSARAAAELRERDAAVESDAALVAYQRKWERRIARMQRARPARWRVPGLSDDEVRDALTLHLIEVLRTEPAPHAAPPAPDKEWGLWMVERHLAELKRALRFGATPMDFRDVVVAERAPSQEQRWLEREEQACRALAEERARQQLSGCQRRWLSALRLSARAGHVFAESAEPNLSAAARLLGKDRSSAQRAYRVLQARFASELEQLE